MPLPVLLIAGIATGLVETRLPAAHFAAPAAFALRIDSAAEFRESTAIWPIVDRVDYADMRPAPLRDGVMITVLDPQRRTRIGPPVAVTFRRESRCAFVLWEVLLSV